ncbi:MAG: hypothetical protein ACI4OR_03755 [Alphaproteobacteria bacterium]
METQQQNSFLAPFFAFHFITLAGIGIAFFIWMISSESQPVSSFLFSPNLYIISSLVAVAVRLLLWIAVDKGTFFEIRRVLGRIIQDVIVINAVILSTLSSIFIAETFFF